MSTEPHKELLVFEDPVDARLFRFQRGNADGVATLVDWMTRAFPTLSATLLGEAERKDAFFAALVPDSPHAAFARATLRRTLEELRWADVLTDDDRALAFSALPTTDTYRSLAAAADALAAAFPGDDIPAMARELPVFTGAAPTFVPAAHGSAVFRNIAQHVQAPLRELSQLDLRERRRKPLCIDGAAVTALPEAVKQIRRATRRGLRVLVLVAGGAAQRAWIESALASAAFGGETPAAKTNPWQKLRTFRALRTADRIRWARRFDRLERHDPDTAWTSLLAEMRRDHVAENTVAALEAHVLTETENAELVATTPDHSSLLVAPLRPVPSVEGTAVFVLVGAGTHETAVPSLLTPYDRARLATVGFPLAESPSPLQALEALTTPSPDRRKIFVFAPDIDSLRARAHLRPAERGLPDTRWNLDGVGDRSPRASATQLSAFAECPAKYLARYRWRWQPTELPENEFHRWVGTLAHALLEHWHRQHPEIPTAGGPDELRAIFPTARATAFREGDGPPPFLETAVARRALALAARGLALEPGFAGRFTARRTFGVELGFEWRSGDVAFGGRYDRIVELANGTILVLDYKTGSVAFTPAHAISGADPQGALYWLAGVERFGDKFGGVLFVSLKEASAERGVLRKSLVGTPPMVRGHVLDDAKWNEGLVAARLAVDLQARRWRDERRFEPTPSLEACERCSYGALCRRRVGDG